MTERKLNPRKLEPPKEVKEHSKKKAHEGKMKNSFYRFLFLFFGEGL